MFSIAHNVGDEPRLTATERSGSEATELSSVGLQRPCYAEWTCFPFEPHQNHEEGAQVN